MADTGRLRLHPDLNHVERVEEQRGDHAREARAGEDLTAAFLFVFFLHFHYKKYEFEVIFIILI